VTKALLSVAEEHYWWRVRSICVEQLNSRQNPRDPMAHNKKEYKSSSFNGTILQKLYYKTTDCKLIVEQTCLMSHQAGHPPLEADDLQSILHIELQAGLHLQNPKVGEN